MVPRKSKPLVEGVDYYMEGTRFVFTAAYHLARGYCCNSRCRHCPYRGEGPAPFDLARIVIERPPPRGDG